MAITGFLYSFGISTVLINLPAAIVVLVTVVKSKKAQNSVMLLSLSFSDLLYGIGVIAIANLFAKKGNVEYSTCTARMFVLAVAYLASVTHMFSISLERICFVCLKIAFFKTHRKTVWVLSIGSSWLLSIILVGFLHIVQGEENDNINGCSLNKILNTEIPVYSIFIDVFQFGVVFNLSVLIYYLYKHQKSMKKSNTGTISTKNIRSIISISFISAVTSLLGLPIAIVLIYGSVEDVSTSVKRALFLLSGLTALSNPIIYIFRVNMYREYVFKCGSYLLCKGNSVAPSQQ